jgi:small subunit ribosomal protein S13
MARLIGVDLPREKRLAIALTYVYGVGRSQASKALEATGIDPEMKSKDLTDDQTLAFLDWIELNLKVEGDLRRVVASDIRRKVEIGCYQGIRHRKGLPVRGQRTHTNARTRKGPARLLPARRRSKRTISFYTRKNPKPLKNRNHIWPPKVPAPRRCGARKKRMWHMVTLISRARSTTPLFPSLTQAVP